MKGMITNLAPVVLDQGIKASDAALLISLYGGCGFVAKLGFAGVADRFGPRALLITSLVGFGSGMACLTSGRFGPAGDRGRRRSDWPVRRNHGANAKPARVADVRGERRRARDGADKHGHALCAAVDAAAVRPESSTSPAATARSSLPLHCSLSRPFSWCPIFVCMRAPKR
jgi:hypothetical protein